MPPMFKSSAAPPLATIESKVQDSMDRFDRIRLELRLLLFGDDGVNAEKKGG